MLSMSGAILRFSWFISNSYSKSEIARRPFTIAFAPCSRAKSTTSVSKGFTCTLGRFCDLRLDELDALLGAEQRLLLAHGLVDDGDDHVVEHLRRAPDDVEVAERDRVVGARADRCARRSQRHGGWRCACRRRCARRSSGKARVSGSRLSDSVTMRACGDSDARKQLGERLRQAGRPQHMAGRRTRGRTRARRRRRRSQASASAATTSASVARARRGSRGSRRAARAVDSTNVALAAPRESASIPSAPEPAKRSSTRSPSTVAEDREERLADAVGRRPGVRSRAAR